MSEYSCGNKPLCCICKTTQEILAIVKTIKCECDLTPVLESLAVLQSDVKDIQEQFKCDCKDDDDKDKDK